MVCSVVLGAVLVFVWVVLATMFKTPRHGICFFFHGRQGLLYLFGMWHSFALLLESVVLFVIVFDGLAMSFKNQLLISWSYSAHASKYRWKALFNICDGVRAFEGTVFVDLMGAS